MERAIFLLPPARILFAQSLSGPPMGLAMKTLCDDTRASIGIITMLCMLAAILPAIAGAALFHFKKDDKNLNLAGMALLAIGGLLLAAALLGIVIYFLVPAIIGAIVGSGTTVAC